MTDMAEFRFEAGFPASYFWHSPHVILIMTHLKRMLYSGSIDPVGLICILQHRSRQPISEETELPFSPHPLRQILPGGKGLQRITAMQVERRAPMRTERGTREGMWHPFAHPHNSSLPKPAWHFVHVNQSQESSFWGTAGTAGGGKCSKNHGLAVL